MCEASSAICDLLEHSPVNKDVADKILDGHCPECQSELLIRWRMGSGFHDLCTHFHCISCDSDYCWPIAWEPPMPVTKMKGELCPRDRRTIAKICKEGNITVPDFWEPIMESDLEVKTENALLICYECNKEQETEVIMQAGEWHWGRGKKPRKWVNTDNEMDFSKQRKIYIMYARCIECYSKVKSLNTGEQEDINYHL